MCTRIECPCNVPSTNICDAVARAVRDQCPEGSIFILPASERGVMRRLKGHNFWKPWSCAGLKLFLRKQRRLYKRSGLHYTLSLCPAPFLDMFLYHKSAF
jgi:hypothetical protein